MKLSMKGMKKVSADSRKTILQHPKGHQIVVAHHALSKQMLDKLSKLPSMYANPSNVETGTGKVNLPGIGYAEGGIAEDFSGVREKIQKWAEEGKTEKQLAAEKLEAEPKTSRPEAELPSKAKGEPVDESKFDLPPANQPVRELKEGEPLIEPAIQTEEIKPEEQAAKKRQASREPASSDEDVAGSVKKLLSASAEQFNKQNAAANAKDGGARKTDFTAEDIYKQIQEQPVPPEQADASTKGKIGEPSPYRGVPVGPQQPMVQPQAAPQEQGLAKQAPMPQTMAPQDQWKTPEQYAGRPMPAVPNIPVPAGLASDPYAQAAKIELSGLKQQAEAAQQAAMAMGEAGAREASVTSMAANVLNRQMVIFEQKMKDMEAERQKLMADADKGYVDPRKLMRELSTGGKILAGVGLLFGGIGSGLTGQPNLAFQMMEKAIDQDIDAQSKNVGIKKTLLENNLKATDNMLSAMQLTKAQLMDLNALHLKQIAAESVDPIKRAEAMRAGGEFMTKAGEIYRTFALRQAMLDAGKAGGESGFQEQMKTLRTMGPEAAKYAEDFEKKHVPGIGNASKEVPREVMEQIANRRDVHDGIVELENYARQYGSAIPVVQHSIITQGKAKAALVLNKMRLGEKMGVFTKADSEFLEDIIKDPTVFFAKYRALPKYKEMKEANLSALNSMLSTYGAPKVTSEMAGVKTKMIKVIAPDGTEGTIPAENKDKAIKRGFKVVQ